MQLTNVQFSLLSFFLYFSIAFHCFFSFHLLASSTTSACVAYVHCFLFFFVCVDLDGLRYCHKQKKILKGKSVVIGKISTYFFFLKKQTTTNQLSHERKEKRIDVVADLTSVFLFDVHLPSSASLFEQCVHKNVTQMLCRFRLFRRRLQPSISLSLHFLHFFNLFFPQKKKKITTTPTPHCRRVLLPFASYTTRRRIV